MPTTWIVSLTDRNDELGESLVLIRNFLRQVAGKEIAYFA